MLFVSRQWKCPSKPFSQGGSTSGGGTGFTLVKDSRTLAHLEAGLETAPCMACQL